MSDRPVPRGVALVRRVATMAVALTGSAACLTVLFLVMRGVMDVGGTCASGGPYTVARPCPEGAWLAPVAIIAGMVLVGVYAVSAIPGGPNWALLAWPALFLSLGWNFLEYGFDPPGPGDGPVWGWLLCGVVFWLMGGAPLVLALRQAGGGGREGLRDGGQVRRAAAAMGAVARARRTGGVVVPPAPPPGPAGRDRDTAGPPPAGPPGAPGTEDADDLVGLLERLARLHRLGVLTDGEYVAAKRRVLEERR